MTSVIPELVDDVMSWVEVVKEKASDRPEGEEEDIGTGTQRVILNFAKVFEDLLTVDEYELQKLAAAAADPKCTCEIYMNEWVVFVEENGVKVTRYKCLFTSVNEKEVSIPDPTIQDLLDQAYPGNPNPPKILHILAHYPDQDDGTVGGPRFHIHAEEPHMDLDGDGAGPPEVVQTASEVKYEDADEKKKAEEMLRHLHYGANGLREEFVAARKLMEMKIMASQLHRGEEI
jgi:hypothetical protein